MHATATPAPPTNRKVLKTRIFWFIAGASLNYLLISTPFKWLTAHTELSDWSKAACSLGVSSSFFFVWNYFVNFRTDARKRDAFWRYLTAAVGMWILSSNTLAYLKSFDAHMAVHLGRFALDMDIVATQFFLAGFKFLLYHKWAFPPPKENTGE